MTSAKSDAADHIINEKLKAAFQRLADGQGDDHDILPAIFCTVLGQLRAITANLSEVRSGQSQVHETLDRFAADTQSRTDHIATQIETLESNLQQDRVAFDAFKQELLDQMRSQSKHVNFSLKILTILAVLNFFAILAVLARTYLLL